MPIISVALPEKITQLQKRKLATELINLTGQLLKKNEQVTVVKFEDIGCDFFTKEESVKENEMFEVEIIISANTNNEQEKSEWITGVWTTMKSNFSINDNLPSYITITEIDRKNWGYNGLTQYQRSTK